MTDDAITAPPAEQGKPDLPPPASVAGPVAWVRDNFFASASDIVLTVLSVALIYFVVPPLLDWLIFSATWTYPPEVMAGDRPPGTSDCTPGGACWIFVHARIGQFLFGFYPDPERWRVVLAFALGAIGIYGLLGGPERFRRHAAIFFFIIFPIVAFWLLRGGLGLTPVTTDLWGGFMLTLVIALVGIVLSQIGRAHV